MTADDELKEIQKEAIMAYFKVLIRTFAWRD